MLRGSLRTKLLLSLVSISALLTAATLMLVRQRVEIRAREEIVRGLRSSVITFQSLQQQREVTLERSAALMAALPPLKAVMKFSRGVGCVMPQRYHGGRRWGISVDSAGPCR